MGAADMPAKQLIAELKAAGFAAGSALTTGDSAVRVIVGPYPDGTTLVQARSNLEAAGYRVIRSW
jgi:cell division septation protein DedD